MSDRVSETSIHGPPGWRTYAVPGDTVFEILSDTRDLRSFRASVMEITRMLSTNQQRRCVLILDEPRISDDRLQDEWRGYRDLFRPEILGRITLVIRREHVLDQILGHLTDEEQRNLLPMVERARQQKSRPTRRPAEAFFDILRVLLIHWFRKSGPVTSKELAEQTGFSYPTIANALTRLENHLMRRSDRRVELRAFPREAWLQLLAQGEKVRSSQGYVDRSGRPRPTDVLLSRLRELEREDVAVSGVVGVRHYLPGIDLAGVPRLDLVVHVGKISDHASLVRRLDPALQPAERGEPCQVVVHTLFRPESFFSKMQDGLRWADEVECLLDLHEMRLESQALEFVEHFAAQATP